MFVAVLVTGKGKKCYFLACVKIKKRKKDSLLCNIMGMNDIDMVGFLVCIINYIFFVRYFCVTEYQLYVTFMICVK